ncbi:shikimate kinase [Candidatus Spyradosoma sp. SGI.093]|uniref:shikimate kinase n=1 Tax=Candidatus Spyradosoma sp. SGI.093 TaxID=3420583 RepID=UPI003D076F93
MHASRNAELSSGPNLILTGFMGTGKSTLGRAIAQAWKRPFRDTDKIIQEREGRTIPEIFAQDGEAAFRGLEKRCVEEWLPESGAVISTGGGIVTIPGIAERLRARGVVVALFASPETILERTRANKNRPLLQCEDPLARIRELLAARERAYMRSGVNVLTDRRPLEELVAIVTRVYRAALRARERETR